MTIALQFHNVTFGYTEAKNVISDVNFALKEGLSYALVGPTGQGKSTTASLMARLYQPVSGTISLYGKQLSEWDKAELYTTIGFILQDPFLFSGTILDNIIYGNKSLEKYADIEDKARFAVFEEYLTKEGYGDLIERFPGGVATEVTNNSENISLGQKQIINFVRVILRKPKFLILDEATANLDTITEQLLQKILDSLPKATTKVIIAHRLNTVKNVDQVLLIAGGKVEIQQ
jgi:ATP-binding cassette, subfamily B, bacterial